MGRAPRITEGGFVYYVVCRGLDGLVLFNSKAECETFEGILRESVMKWEPRVLAFALHASEWHILAMPRKDGDLSRWIAWVTSVHSMRNKSLRAGTASNGLYERRFRSFPVQDNERLIDAILWIESGFTVAEAAEGEDASKTGAHGMIQSSYSTRILTVSRDWISLPPVALPADWSERVLQGLNRGSAEQIVNSIDRGAPYGDAAWVTKMATRFKLESTLRPRGRPRTSK